MYFLSLFSPLPPCPAPILISISSPIPIPVASYHCRHLDPSVSHSPSLSLFHAHCTYLCGSCSRPVPPSSSISLSLSLSLALSRCAPSLPPSLPFLPPSLPPLPPSLPPLPPSPPSLPSLPPFPGDDTRALSVLAEDRQQGGLVSLFYPGTEYLVKLSTLEPWATYTHHALVTGLVTALAGYSEYTVSIRHK